MDARADGHVACNEPIFDGADAQVNAQGMMLGICYVPVIFAPGGAVNDMQYGDCLTECGQWVETHSWGYEDFNAAEYWQPMFMQTRRSRKGRAPRAPRPKRQHAFVPRRLNLQEQSKESVQPHAEKTTLMIRNVPNHYDRMQLMNELDALGFRDKYDFLYLPIDTSTQWNVGYAFINFEESEQATICMEVMNGYEFQSVRTLKRRAAHVSFAHVQGLEQNVANLQGTSLFASTPMYQRPWLKHRLQMRTSRQAKKMSAHEQEIDRLQAILAIDLPDEERQRHQVELDKAIEHRNAYQEMSVAKRDKRSRSLDVQLENELSQTFSNDAVTDTETWVTLGGSPEWEVAYASHWFLLPVVIPASVVEFETAPNPNLQTLCTAPNSNEETCSRLLDHLLGGAFAGTGRRDSFIFMDNEDANSAEATTPSNAACGGMSTCSSAQSEERSSNSDNGDGNSEVDEPGTPEAEEGGSDFMFRRSMDRTAWRTPSRTPSPIPQRYYPIM